jgi:hypothetical protein
VLSCETYHPCAKGRGREHVYKIDAPEVRLLLYTIGAESVGVAKRGRTVTVYGGMKGKSVFILKCCNCRQEDCNMKVYPKVSGLSR